MVGAITLDSKIRDIDGASHRKPSALKTSAEPTDSAEQIHSSESHRLGSAQSGQHAGGGVFWRFMLPRSDNSPPVFSESDIDPLIALSVAIELLGPELRVRLRLGSVLGTTMPKAAIHEYCDPTPHKRHIRANTELGTLDSIVLAKAGPSPKQGAAKCCLRPGVRPLVRPHRSPNPLGRSPRGLSPLRCLRSHEPAILDRAPK